MAVVVGVCLLTPSASTAAGKAEARPDLTVKLLSANGSGCPRGSSPPVVADVLPTGVVAVRYGNFVVTGGDYKTCVVVVNLATTAAWTYTIPSVENRVWADLDTGGTARLGTSMWFTGFAWTLRDNKQIAGPLNNYWRAGTAHEQQTWAPCGQSVNLAIAETVRVAEAPSNTASLITTTLDPPTWKRC